MEFLFGPKVILAMARGDLVNQGLAYNPSNALLYTLFQYTHSLSGSLYLIHEVFRYLDTKH